MHFQAFSRRGRDKPRNEDALLLAGVVRQGSVDASGWVDAAHPVVLAVADGVGASHRPRRASRTLLAMLAARLARDPMQNLGHLLWALHADYKALGTSRTSVGMASTLVGVRIVGQSVSVFNVGDSPAIVLNGAGGWTQLSHDHTQLQEMVDACEIAPEQARDVGSIYGGLTSQFISEPDADEFQVNLSHHTLQQNETLLLASDGLTEVLSHHGIANLLVRQETLALAELFHAARARGGEDDFSVIAVRLD